MTDTRREEMLKAVADIVEAAQCIVGFDGAYVRDPDDVAHQILSAITPAPEAGWRDFHDWWSTDGHAIDPEPDVSWYDKRRDFAEMAFNAARYQAPGEQPDAVQEARDAVIHEADFLLDRLKQYEADGCQCSRSVREWCGHVSPPMARLEAALRALKGGE